MTRCVLILFLFFSHLTFAQDARTVARKVLPSVVKIEVSNSSGHVISFGSGFFVRADVVATNYHVIENAFSARVTVVGTTQVFDVIGLVGTKKLHDIALLKLPGMAGVPLPLANVNKVELGEDIYVIGNPKGLEGSISTGIISSTNRAINGEDRMLQITAPVSPGSSGGPVVNSQGEVIGIASGTLLGGQNLNFAVPVDYLISLLRANNEVTPLPGMDDPKRSSEASSDETEREQPDWVKIGNTKELEFYYNPRRTVKKQNSVTIWIKQVPRLDTDEGKSSLNKTVVDIGKFKLGQAELDAALHRHELATPSKEKIIREVMQYSHKLERTEFDCEDQTTRILESILYSKDGNIIITIPGTRQWVGVTPGSVGEATMEAACKR